MEKWPPLHRETAECASSVLAWTSAETRICYSRESKGRTPVEGEISSSILTIVAICYTHFYSRLKAHRRVHQHHAGHAHRAVVDLSSLLARANTLLSLRASWLQWYNHNRLIPSKYGMVNEHNIRSVGGKRLFKADLTEPNCFRAFSDHRSISPHSVKGTVSVIE